MILNSVDKTNLIGKKISVLQFISGSVLANIHKIRSRLEEQRPDLVLIQESNLKKEQYVKFNEYNAIRTNRITPRNSKKKIREEEVLILINNYNKKLKFKELNPLQTNNNNTIEIARVRLYIEEDKKAFVIDILNICILLMHKKDKNKERV